MNGSASLRLACTLISLVAMLLGFAGSAEARLRFELRDSNGTAYVQISGDFEYEDSLVTFSQIIREKHPKFVTFDSPGGNIAKALELGRLIRKSGLATFGSRRLECDSACAFAFMGGIQRTADPNSIGMHKASLRSPDGVSVEEAVSTIQDLTARVIAYMSEMGIDPGILEVALTYNSDDIRYLTTGEMQRYRVITGDTSAPVVTSDGGKEGDTDTNTGNQPGQGPDSDTQISTLETDRPAPDLAKPLSNRPGPANPANADTGFTIPDARSGRIRSPDGEAALKAVANESSRNLAMLPNGTPLKIVDDRGAWYRVSTPKGVGYVHESRVFVDQYLRGPYESRFIQVNSFQDYANAEAFVKNSDLPLAAELARNGWFAVTLDESYSVAASEALLAKLKARGQVPDDAFVTYGNTYVRKVCCE